MHITINPAARTVVCRNCGGTGDEWVGDEVETCFACNGSGRHAADASYGVLDQDGGRIISDGRAETALPVGLKVLAGLNRLSHVYAGTVPAATVARRRKANKAARAARRVTRRSSK